jgi:hypothetical protein
MSIPLLRGLGGGILKTFIQSASLDKKPSDFQNQPKITTPSFRVKKTSHTISFRNASGMLRFPQHDEMQNNP